MNVVILCGGQGTRLREETEYRPKPLVEIGGRPILWHIMKLYAYYGFSDFKLCLGYKGNMIKEYFLNYEEMNNDFTIKLGQQHQITHHEAHAEQNFRVTLADTGLDSMTGGRVRRVQRYVEGETFMVTYGDGVSNVNIRELLAFHRSHGKVATISTVKPTSRYGILDIDEHSGTVHSFQEKPQLEGWASCGYFVFNREIFDLLTGDECILEREPLEHLATRGELVAYRHQGFFFAMDTYREYKLLNDLWTAGNAAWKVWQ